MPRIKLPLPSKIDFEMCLTLRVSDMNYGGHMGNDSVLSLAHEARIRFLKKHNLLERDFYGYSLLMADSAVVYKKDIIVTGGWTSGDKTDKMHIITSSKVEVKSLKRAREYHGCETFRLKQKDILVIAGGYKEKSTEFVLLDNNMESQEG